MIILNKKNFRKSVHEKNKIVEMKVKHCVFVALSIFFDKSIALSFYPLSLKIYPIDLFWAITNDITGKIYPRVY